MSEEKSAIEVLKQAQHAIIALQRHIQYLERQLEGKGSSASLQERVNGWFTPLTAEQKAEREAEKLASEAEEKRQEDNESAYEEAEAAKKAARDKLEYDSRNHATLYR